MTAIDALIGGFVLLGLWQGYRAGLLRALVGMFGWLVALMTATVLARPLAPWVAGWLGIETDWLARVASFAVLAVAVVLTLHVVLWVLRRTLQGLRLGFLDRLAGAGFGAARNLLVVLVGLSTLVPLTADAKIWQDSRSVQVLLPWAPFGMALSRQLTQQVHDGGRRGMGALQQAVDGQNTAAKPSK